MASQSVEYASVATKTFLLSSSITKSGSAYPIVFDAVLDDVVDVLVAVGLSVSKKERFFAVNLGRLGSSMLSSERFWRPRNLRIFSIRTSRSSSSLILCYRQHKPVDHQDSR